MLDPRTTQVSPCDLTALRMKLVNTPVPPPLWERHQRPSSFELIGLLFLIVADAAAQRGGYQFPTVVLPGKVAPSPITRRACLPTDLLEARFTRPRPQVPARQRRSVPIARRFAIGPDDGDEHRARHAPGI